MMHYPKKILLAFSSYFGRKLVKEILKQLEPGLQIDYVTNEMDLEHYVTRRSANQAPGLIILDSPPVSPATARLIDGLRRENAYGRTPVAFFLSPRDIPLMRQWAGSEGQYFYPHSDVPSECKLYLRQMLELYSAGLPEFTDTK
jgi:hypothetical protein